MATDTESFDLAYRLKNKPEYRNVPIVLVTGFTQRMAELGPERFQHILGEDWPASQMFENPIDPEELLAAVEALRQGAGEVVGRAVPILRFKSGRENVPPGHTKGL